MPMAPVREDRRRADRGYGQAQSPRLGCPVAVPPADRGVAAFDRFVSSYRRRMAPRLKPSNGRRSCRQESPPSRRRICAARPFPCAWPCRKPMGPEDGRAEMYLGMSPKGRSEPAPRCAERNADRRANGHDADAAPIRSLPCVRDQPDCGNSVDDEKQRKPSGRTWCYRKS